MTAVKTYHPSTAREEFYCERCESNVTIGEKCCTVRHPVEIDGDLPRNEAICNECLLQEAE